jgi:hypothetical protein
VGVKVRFGFGLGIIFLTFKTFGNNFNISHRKAPLPISSAARLDVRKDTEVPDPCVSYVSVLFDMCQLFFVCGHNFTLLF